MSFNQSVTYYKHVVAQRYGVGLATDRSRFNSRPVRFQVT